jgi:serine/threonine protein phosphatase PrpC
MEIAFATEAGAQPVNEDACDAWPELGVCIACDGLANKLGGDFASRLAVNTIGNWAKINQQVIEAARQTPEKGPREKVQALLHEAFQEASRGIFQKSSSDAALAGMCTTMDVLVLLGSHAVVAHVGSGRVYLLRNEELHQLTEDHTQLAHMRRQGKLEGITPAQQASFAKRLMRAVGFREEVQVDILGVELEAGDRFFVVTDGVWASLGDSEFEKVAVSAGTPKALLKNLHAFLGPGKARDNFSTIVVDPPKQVESSGAAQKIKMLGTVPAFAYLSYQELIRVINSGELVKVSGGREIWKEGDKGGEMMLVLSGTVKIVKNGQQINVMSKGDVVGEMSMIDNAPRSAAAVAETPTNLLAFPRAALFELFREEPGLAVKFLWGVTMEMNKRLRAVSNQLVGGTERTAATPLSSGPLPFHRGKG